MRPVRVFEVERRRRDRSCDPGFIYGDYADIEMIFRSIQEI